MMFIGASPPALPLMGGSRIALEGLIPDCLLFFS